MPDPDIPAMRSFFCHIALSGIMHISTIIVGALRAGLLRIGGVSPITA